MEYCATIALSQDELNLARDILKGSPWAVMDAMLSDSVCYTAIFSNGCEADIKVVIDADSPYIDPVLFDPNGHEITCLQDESTNLLGEYRFDVGEDSYIVCVKEAVA